MKKWIFGTVKDHIVKRVDPIKVRTNIYNNKKLITNVFTCISEKNSD